MSASVTQVVVVAPGANSEVSRVYDWRFVEETTYDRAPVEILSVVGQKPLQIEKPS